MLTMSSKGYRRIVEIREGRILGSQMYKAVWGCAALLGVMTWESLVSRGDWCAQRWWAGWGLVCPVSEADCDDAVVSVGEKWGRGVLRAHGFVFPTCEWIQLPVCPPLPLGIPSCPTYRCSPQLLFSWSMTLSSASSLSPSSSAISHPFSSSFSAFPCLSLLSFFFSFSCSLSFPTSFLPSLFYLFSFFLPFFLFPSSLPPFLSVYLSVCSSFCVIIHVIFF